MRRFWVEPHPPRVAGNDNYGLKNTQGRCGAEGKTPGDSVQVQHCLATNVIQKFLTPKAFVISGIVLKRIVMTLDKVKWVNIKFIGFFVWGWARTS